MRKFATRAVTILAVIVVLIAIDEGGYRLWRNRFVATAHQIARSPSAMDGKPRAASMDAAAYQVKFGLQPDRFVVYSGKPVSALAYEPPWYVWSYTIASRSAAIWPRYERFLSGRVAEMMWLTPHDPCHMQFSREGLDANCGWATIVSHEPLPPQLHR